MTRIKGCKFNALLLGKAGFLMTRQKLDNWCINTWKSMFSHDATENKVYICCIDTFRSRFSLDVQRLLYLMQYYVEEQVFFMTRQKGANLLHYYVEKQVFSWHAKNSYNWCIYTWKGRFSHDSTEKPRTIWCVITFKSKFSRDTQKTFIFLALLCGKAGFLLMHQKLKCVCLCIISWWSNLLMAHQISIIFGTFLA